jgi:hypothetical protein
MCKHEHMELRTTQEQGICKDCKRVFNKEETIKIIKERSNNEYTKRSR